MHKGADGSLNSHLLSMMIVGGEEYHWVAGCHGVTLTGAALRSDPGNS